MALKRKLSRRKQMVREQMKLKRLHHVLRDLGDHNLPITYNKNRILWKKARNQEVLAEMNTLGRNKTFSQTLKNKDKKSYLKIHNEINPRKIQSKNIQRDIFLGRQNTTKKHWCWRVQKLKKQLWNCRAGSTNWSDLSANWVQRGKRARTDRESICQRAGLVTAKKQ